MYKCYTVGKYLKHLYLLMHSCLEMVENIYQFVILKT